MKKYGSLGLPLLFSALDFQSAFVTFAPSIQAAVTTQ
jgi:hypothetical protein